MIKIKINSRKYANQYASIDDSDFELVSKFRWNVRVYNRSRYAYATDISTGKFVDIHRLIMKPARNLLVDHKDHNGLNNQRENLRVCTQAENKRNVLRPSNNTSGYKGVHFREGLKKRWRVKIEVDKKQIYGGYFSDIREAAKKYNELAIKYFGEFAHLNKVA